VELLKLGTGPYHTCISAELTAVLPLSSRHSHISLLIKAKAIFGTLKSDLTKAVQRTLSSRH